MVADSWVSTFAAALVGWLLTYALHSTLVLLGVWAFTSCGRLGEGTKEVLWKAALVAGLVTATIQAGIEREPLAGQVRLRDPAGAGGRASVRLELRDGVVSGMRRVPVARSRDLDWALLAATVWLGAAGVALLWLSVSHARVTRVLDERSSLAEAPMADQLHALLARCGVTRPVELTCSAAIASPLALAGGEVCLPRRALIELDDAEQESMLAHEAAHVVRRDPEWLLIARVIEALFFFQPLNRLARKRIQEAAEYLCDDWAVQRTDRPLILAKCLAAVAEWVGSAPRRLPVSAMVAADGSPLVRRVRRILGDGSVRRAQSRAGALAASAGAILVLAGVAPRVSVASTALADRTVMFVRAIAREDARAAGGAVTARAVPLRLREEAGRRRVIDGAAMQRHAEVIVLRQRSPR